MKISINNLSKDMNNGTATTQEAVQALSNSDMTNSEVLEGLLMEGVNKTLRGLFLQEAKSRGLVGA